MPSPLDGRPEAVNVWFRPGNEFALPFTWEDTGALTGRTFTATLDAANLGVAIVGDVLTVTMTDEQTAAAAETGDFTLTETTGGISDAVIVGSWHSSNNPAAEQHPTAVTVRESAGAVTVTAQGIPTAVGNLHVASDLTVTGEILTGTFGSPATFGGIEREGRVFPVGEMVAPGCAINVGDGFPRLHMPDDVTSTAYMLFEVEEWWLDSTIGVYFEWVNDHSSTGNVRWDCDIKECDIATQTLAAAGTIATRTFTESAPAANTSTTSIVSSITNGNPCTFAPGVFASFYVLRISRLGADAADTLNGPVGLLAASMTRGQ